MSQKSNYGEPFGATYMLTYNEGMRRLVKFRNWDSVWAYFPGGAPAYRCAPLRRGFLCEPGAGGRPTPGPGRIFWRSAGSGGI